MFSVKADLCSRLCFNLFNQSETAVSRSQAWPPSSLSVFYFLCIASPCQIARAFGFTWFTITSACVLLNLVLCSLTRKEFWKPLAIRGHLCACQSFQLRGVLCFEVAAVSRGEGPPHAPKWDRRKSFITDLVRVTLRLAVYRQYELGQSKGFFRVRVRVALFALFVLTV
jgi:hypothetical protein